MTSQRNRTGTAPVKTRQDLVARTSRFDVDVITLARTVKPDAVTRPLVSQLVRAGTSVGANYSEANEAESRLDFKHKTSICAKEARETQHWLHMLTAACPEHKTKARELWSEAKELTLIFGAIVRSCRNQPGKPEKQK